MRNVSMLGQRRVFRVAVVLAVSTLLLLALVIGSGLPLPVRQGVTGAALVLTGLGASGCAAWRAWISSERRRRPWVLLAVAGLVAFTGNAWAAAVGADPAVSPSVFSDVSIAVALLLSIAGLLSFPGARRRGLDLLLLLLDGVVVGLAMMIIASALVYSSLRDARGSESLPHLTALAIPALDIALVTVALILLLKSRGADRPALALVAAGFVMYAAADLFYATHVARGDFQFGGWVDLGWISGYLLIGMAACYPQVRSSAGQPVLTGRSETADTVLVLTTLGLAIAAQLGVGDTPRPGPTETVLLLLLAASAGSRQLLLARDHHALRRGLEKRVADQTADLHRMGRQTEILLSSVGDGIYGVDERGAITFVNPSAAAALGYTAEELHGRNAHDAFHAPAAPGISFPYDGCYVSEAISSAAATSAEEDHYLRADGSTFPVEITASPLLEHGTVLGAVVTFRDITQRREVDRMKNEFLSVVSHELRTPLTSIRGSLGLLSSGQLGELSPRAASMTGIALESSERLTRLINDILDLERIESGSKPMELTACPVRDLVLASVTEMEGMARSSGVQVEIGDCPGMALADRDRVVQTLTNLLGNALKFSAPGTRVLVDTAMEPGRVRFRVQDEGRGIPPTMLDSIFERFQQVDSSDARQKGGTGLGLAISRGIVERHGGHIWAESAPGSGATVLFTLPAARETATEEDPYDHGDMATVLVCHDDPSAAASFSTTLRQHGYRTINASNGREAIDLVDRERPGALLLDLDVAGVGGLEVIREIRANERTRGVPVVVVSDRPPDERPDVDCGADGWLVEPFDSQQLVSAVAFALAERAQGSTVLLVEDDHHLAGVVSTLLTGHGLHVVHATTAADAIRLGPHVRPRVLVLDLQLPDADGSEVVAAFRRCPGLSDVATIVYSAADVEGQRREALSLGETVFLTKGRVAPEILEDRVLDLLGAVTGQIPERTG